MKESLENTVRTLYSYKIKCPYKFIESLFSLFYYKAYTIGIIYILYYYHYLYSLYTLGLYTLNIRSKKLRGNFTLYICCINYGLVYTLVLLIAY